MLDKPAGMVVHPGAGHASGTLVNALLHHVKDLSGVGGEARPGIVHRLDRGTSGLMVVAKHDKAHQELARQFQRPRSREGIHRARLGRRAGRAAHRRADRARSEGPAEDVDPRAAGAQRGDAGHLRAALQGRLVHQGGDRHRPYPSDPRAPERHRPPDRRRPDLRRRAPPRREQPARGDAARTAVPARVPARASRIRATAGASSSTRRCRRSSKRWSRTSAEKEEE